MLEQTQLEKLVDNLNIIKEEFFKNKDELKMSIRKDVIVVELRSIIENNNTYETLVKELNNYINILLDK